jgi:hypothetical protein
MSLVNRSAATSRTGGRPGATARSRTGSRVSGALSRIGGMARGALRGRPGAHRRHRRGITAAQIRGFNRVSSMLARFGMVPKKLGRRGARVHRKD